MRRLLPLLGIALAALPIPAQDAARAALRRLTPEQKVGQLFMSWILSQREGQDEARAKMLGWLREPGLGGVVLSLGTAEEAQALISDLQQHAEVPLLMAGDFETGVAFRLEGTTHLGCNMLVGATGLPRLAQAMGRVTATEGRALGFHWCFAPVVDVNVDPRNPIINVRSFGEDPQQVARFGAAFVRGCEGAGMLATAKHFPGHGDVSSDSHLTMPTVPGDRARLDAVELPPFRAAIDAGVSTIMTGHLAVPGLGEDPGIPATLSTKILTDLLRGTFGFDGIIVTDALDMGGVRKTFPPEEVAWKALAAGADLLLMPPDPIAARDAVLAAVHDGRVPAARLDDAVLRLLKAKERMGLLSGGGLPATNWREIVGSPEHEAVAQEIARRGVTLVQDDEGLLPLPEGKVVLVTLLDQDGPEGQAFATALAAGGREVEVHRVHPGSEPAQLDAARDALASADLAVLALHVRVRSYSGRIGLPPELHEVATALGSARRPVAVSFGNPYLIDELPQVSTYLCAYNGGPHTEPAVADALTGRQPVTGRLPVSIPDHAKGGEGLTFLPGRELGRAPPEQEGLPGDLGARIDALLQQAVTDHVFPGAVALVARRGVVVVETAVGKQTYDDDAPPVTADARFDLASLTKVCATAPAALRLIAEGKLSLDQRVHELVPAFTGEEKDRVTIRHLLTHSAGLPPFERFYEDLEGKDAIVEAAAKTPLQSAPGERTTYSDLGMILLMACIEAATGEDFEAVVQREVFDPLQMETATFTHTGSPIEAMPTEDCPWRGHVVVGEVHDENAYAMGGVSGHAGLFGTARDVAEVGVAFLGGGRGWLPPTLARAAIFPQQMVPESSRALGWDTFRPGGSGGSRLSPAAFGHTGFTGTSIWCDPRSDLCLVLLTNRVYPSREGNGIGGVRAAFADLVAEALAEGALAR